MSQPIALPIARHDQPLLAKAFSPLNYTAVFSELQHLTASEWTEHTPFAMALVEMTRPSVLVELGTQGGVSYCAFCQAIERLQIDCRAYAVDTWKGDPQTQLYGEEVYQQLKRHHDARYSHFSRLVRATFDEALEHFSDHSIDLLHIDGYHIYDAVKHDFETWLPKMSDAGVVLFHDINVRERDFGAWKFWEEISGRYPSFAFHHQHGLGVLAVGSDCPQPVLNLCSSSEPEAHLVREFYAHLGRRSSLRLQMESLQHQLHFEQARATAYEREFANATQSVTILNEQLQLYKEKFGTLGDVTWRSLARLQVSLIAEAVAPDGTRRRNWIRALLRR